MGLRIGGEEMTRVAIDPERCRKDGLCVSVCRKVFSQESKDSIPVALHKGSCNSCGHCLLVCPSGAISLEGCRPEMIHPVRGELTPSYEQVYEMIVSRRSSRTFLERPVEKEVIEKVIDGARFAPSAKNSESTQYTVIRDSGLLRAIAQTTAQWLGTVAHKLRNPVLRKLYLLTGAARDEEEVKRWIVQFEDIGRKMDEKVDLVLHGAPVLILFHADGRVRFASENANLALQNATFVACSLGLGTFYTGYVVSALSRDKEAQKLLSLPKRHKVYAGLAVGYPGLRFSRWIERNPPKITWL